MEPVLLSRYRFPVQKKCIKNHTTAHFNTIIQEFIMVIKYL